MHLQEETKRSEKTYQGKVFYVTRDQAELEDGKLVQRDVVHHSGGVCVVPLTDKGTVLMVQQFRYPMQQVTLEVPAGKIEPGEDPAECGRRELSEEAGRTCERYTYLGKLFPTPAYDTEVIHMYLAEKTLPPHRTESGRGRVSGCDRASAGGGGADGHGRSDSGCQDADCPAQNILPVAAAEKLVRARKKRPPKRRSAENIFWILEKFSEC